MRSSVPRGRLQGKCPFHMINDFLQYHMTDNSHVLNLVMFQPLAKHHYKTKCSGTRVLTRAVTARARQWQVGKKSVVVEKRTLRATTQARCLKWFFTTVCSFFLQRCVSKANSILSTSELVASSASLASMDPSQQEDYVASLRCVPSRTKVIQSSSSCPGEDFPSSPIHIHLKNTSSPFAILIPIHLRNTVRRLQEKECSFEASDPLEEAGEDLWDSPAFYIFDTFTNWLASLLHCGRRDDEQ